ncbi:MAG TPA: hypothetical protein VF472_01630 [Burkholderiaceae bacterium]
MRRLQDRDEAKSRAGAQAMSAGGEKKSESVNDSCDKKCFVLDFMTLSAWILFSLCAVVSFENCAAVFHEDLLTNPNGERIVAMFAIDSTAIFLERLF